MIGNQGTSALLNTEVRDNHGAGAAIFNFGTMTIINSQIHDNTARFTAGGIVNRRGTLTIVRSTIERNEGLEANAGGIDIDGGVLSMRDSLVSENFGQFTGGVSTFSGELTIVDSTFFNNTGGVVSAISAGAVARISRTSILGNRVGFGVFFGGSAIFGGNETLIENTTIAGNVSTLPFGACCAVVGGVLINSTIADNVGTAGQVAHATLQNTIVDRTGFTAGVGPDCSSGITSLGNNIIGDPSGCADALQASDRTGSAGLASGSNAFVTGVVPLLSTSQAIDAANATACPSLDQRRLPRVDGNGDGIVQCDIGAAEFVQHVVDIRVEPQTFSTNAGRTVRLDVFGTSEFDPETIDLTTARAGVTGYEHVPRRDFRFADVDGDGSVDLELHFRASTLGIACDTPIVAFTAKTVSGETVAGVSEVAPRNCRLRP